MRTLKILHLFPELLDLYGDKGNILCMRRRLEWRGIECQTEEIGFGDELRLAGSDIVFVGGGEEANLRELSEKMRGPAGEEIRAAAGGGTVFLATCCGMQMLGGSIVTPEGAELEMAGALDMRTAYGSERMMGNYIFEAGAESGGMKVVGFENHAGMTWLGSGVQPLGTIVKGHGNNGSDGTEGARVNNVFCTYCHGPLLPKNPAFCDMILGMALDHKYGDAALEELDDSFENAAHDVMIERIMNGTDDRDE